MRYRLLLAAVVAIFALGFVAPQRAEAFVGWYDRDSRSAGLGHSRAVRMWHYRPRYRYRVHSYQDPYAYRYEPRGYYPYYNAGYWRPAWTQRNRYAYQARAPRYHAAWGYGARRCGHRHHRRWHARGHHHRHQHRCHRRWRHH
jgi:hypothetical protein